MRSQPNDTWELKEQQYCIFQLAQIKILIFTRHDMAKVYPQQSYREITCGQYIASHKFCVNGNIVLNLANKIIKSRTTFPLSLSLIVLPLTSIGVGYEGGIIVLAKNQP